MTTTKERRGSGAARTRQLPPEINQSKTDFTVVYDEAAVAGSNGKKANGARRGMGRVRDALRPKIRFGLERADFHA